MIQLESVLKSQDYTGVKTGTVIHIYKGSRRTVPGRVNDLILVASKRIDFRILKKRKTTCAIITKTKKNQKRCNGHYLKFSYTGFISLFDKETFKEQKMRGLIANELRFNKITGILTSAKRLI